MANTTSPDPTLCMKPSEVAEFLTYTIPARIPVMLIGAPGIGKSDVLTQGARNAGAQYVVFHPSIEDPTDAKGIPHVANGLADHIPFANARIMYEAIDLTLIHLEDLGQATPAVQAAYMEPVLNRTLNGRPISDQVCFVASTNRRIDRANVGGILEPVKSRFELVQMEPDLMDWVRWALDHNMPTELIAFCQFKPDLLFDFTPTPDMTNSSCPRTVARVGQLMGLGLPAHLEYKAYAGAAGAKFAGILIGFLKIARELPNPDLILMAPDRADVPTRLDVMLALIGALVPKASPNTITRWDQYVARLPKDIQVFAWTCVQHNQPTIVNTREFIAYQARCQDVIM